MREKFIGTWRLVKIELHEDDGTVTPSPSLGPNARGRLIYTENGHMMGVLMNPDRKPFSMQSSPVQDEILEAYRGFYAYSGTWEVNETEDYVVHHTDLDIIPNEVGADKIRYYRFEGNRLMLSPPLIRRKGRPAIITLTWEKVEE